jgi:NADH dehydrogenase
MAWLFIHIFFLIGFRNRFVVLVTRAWAYFTHQRSARLIMTADLPESRRRLGRKRSAPVQSRHRDTAAVRQEGEPMQRRTFSARR